VAFKLYPKLKSYTLAPWVGGGEVKQLVKFVGKKRFIFNFNFRLLVPLYNINNLKIVLSGKQNQ